MNKFKGPFWITKNKGQVDYAGSLAALELSSLNDQEQEEDEILLICNAVHLFFFLVSFGVHPKFSS